MCASELRKAGSQEEEAGLHCGPWEGVRALQFFWEVDGPQCLEDG